MTAMTMIIEATTGMAIKPAMTGTKKPEAWMSSLTKSLAEGKERLCFFLSIMGKMPESLPLTTLSALTRKTKSGLKPIFRLSGRRMQLLFRSSATTTQSLGRKFSCFRIFFSIFSFQLLLVLSYFLIPYSLFCYSIPKDEG